MEKKNIIISIIIGCCIICLICIILIIKNYKSNVESEIIKKTSTNNNTSNNNSSNSNSTTSSNNKPIDPLLNLAGPNEDSLYKNIPIKYVTNDSLLENPALVLSENSYADFFRTVNQETMLKVVSEQTYKDMNKTLQESVPPARTRFLFRNKFMNLCPDADVIGDAANIDDDVKKNLPPNAYYGGFCASDLSTFRYDPFYNLVKVFKNPGMCLYAPNLNENKKNIIAKRCDKNDPNQKIIFEKETGKIKVMNKNICLEGAGMYEPIVVADCNKTYRSEREAKKLIFEIK